MAAALAAFRTAVLEDYGQAPAAYLSAVRAMAAGNGVAESMVAARNLLKTNGLPPRDRAAGPGSGRPRRPVAAHRWERRAGLRPPGAELHRRGPVSGRPDAARQRRSGALPSTVTEAVKRSALVTEWQLDPELESLLAVEAGPHADHLTDEQRVQIAAYQATREASGHGDDPLLRPTYPIAWRHPVVPTPSARKDAAQRRRMQ